MKTSHPFWPPRPRIGHRPVVPTRMLHWSFFVLGGVLPLAMLAYLVWAHARGLLSGSEALSVWAQSVAVGAVWGLIGFVLRLRWARSLAALLDHDRTTIEISARESAF
jgi:hypothetical protein